MEKYQEYKISKDLRLRYMFKKATYDAIFMIIPLCILLALFMLGSDFASGIKLISKIYIGILWFLGGIFLFSLISFNVPFALRFGIGDNRFTKFYDDSKLHFLSRYTFRMMKRKSGENQSQKIYFNDLEKVEVKRNRIVIKGKNYNLFNGNGRIVIPNEVEDYDKIKKYILKDFKRLIA